MALRRRRGRPGPRQPGRRYQPGGRPLPGSMGGVGSGQGGLGGGNPPGGRGGGGRAGGGRPNQGGGKGGGKNGGKGGGKKNDKPKPPGIRSRALNDIQTAYQPMLDAIRRAQEEAQARYTTNAARVQDIYSAANTQLSALGPQYAQATAGIAPQLTEQIGGLANLLGSTVPGVPMEEIVAGTNSVGTTGSGALQQLASDAQRNVGFNTSAMRQGTIEGMTANRNYLQDLSNELDDLATRGLDLRQEMPGQILARLGELQDQRFSQRMAQKEFALRRAAAAAAAQDSKAFEKYIKDAIGSGGGGGGRRRGGGGGQGGGGGGGGGQGGGGGDQGGGQVSQKRLRQTYAPVLRGGQTWAQLTPQEENLIRQNWDNPQLMNAVRQEHLRLFPNQTVSISSAQDLIRYLRAIQKKIAGMAQDPTPGPGPGR